MKKRISGRILCLAVLFLLCGCARVSDKISGEELVFPGTEWNMTPEEVRAALDVSEEEWSDRSVVLDDGYNYELSGCQLLGHEVGLTFCFREFAESGQIGLSFVVAYFQDGTTADALLAQLTEQLGEGVDRNGLLVWNSTRTVEPEMQQAFDVIGEAYTGTPEEMAERIENSRKASFANLWLLENAAESFDALHKNKLYFLPDAPECPALLFDGRSGVSMIHSLVHYQELFG